MKIPFVDLKAQYLSLKDHIDSSIASVLDETAFIGGQLVKDFEDSFAKLYGVKHCISTANGTDSLFIVMKMLGIGVGDEVITVANSWISTSETISLTGAKPVFVDINPQYYSIDECKLEAVITNKTKCIIPVHLHGQMCKMDEIMAIASKYGIPVLEDCAQSHFSEFKSQRAGTFGIAGSFSFYPGKNLGAYGDAGAIITNDDNLAEMCRLFARHGAKVKHQHEIEGINSRLDGIQAAILLTKLPHILNWTDRRIEVAEKYNEMFCGLGDIIVPKIRNNTKHTFHLYVIRTSKRNDLQRFLKQHGIGTAIHYPVALPNMKAYSYLGYSFTDFPVASEFQEKILSLPIYPEISESQIDYLFEVVKKFSF